VHSLDTVVQQLRARKSPAEVALLRRATEISARAPRRGDARRRAGCNEGEIQAVLEGTFRRQGAERPGYGSIVGSGPNALKLHWDVNDRTMRAGDLLLIDAAAALQHYSSDVTAHDAVGGASPASSGRSTTSCSPRRRPTMRQIRAGGTGGAGQRLGGAGWSRQGSRALELIDAADATYDSATPLPRRRLRAGVAVRVARLRRARDRARGARPGAVLLRRAPLPAGRRLHPSSPGIYVNPAVLDGFPTRRATAMIARLRPAMQRYENVACASRTSPGDEQGIEWLSAGVPREPAAIEALMRERPAPLPGGGTCGEVSS
jgi:Xaa-Pro aminopeptidase